MSTPNIIDRLDTIDGDAVETWLDVDVFSTPRVLVHGFCGCSGDDAAVALDIDELDQLIGMLNDRREQLVDVLRARRHVPTGRR